MIKSIEIFALILGLIYLFLEIQQDKRMWLVGLLSSAIYIFLFFNTNLYASATIQFYYLILSIYGWFRWSDDQKGNRDSKEKFYREISLTGLIFYSLSSIPIFLLTKWILVNYSNDPRPIMEAIVTTLTVTATLWLSKKYLHHWLLWFISNIFSTVLYFQTELYFTALLFLIYSVFSVVGFIAWRKFTRVL